MGNLRRAGACDGYHSRIKRYGLGPRGYTAPYHSGCLEWNRVRQPSFKKQPPPSLPLLDRDLILRSLSHGLAWLKGTAGRYVAGCICIAVTVALLGHADLPQHN